MAKLMRFLPVLLVLCVIHFLPSALAEFNVVTFGAKPDGKTDSTRAFLLAWAAACGSTSPATIHVPSGQFLVGLASFTGPCKNNAIKIWIEGTVVAPSNYNSLGTTGKWLSFDQIDGLSIIGGTIDGQGAALWSCKRSNGNCPLGATSLTIAHSTNIKVSKLTTINSKLFHVAFYGCTGVTVEGVKVSAPWDSPNTDGIHVQGSSTVTITGTTIKTGDDCISIGPGSTNLWIENVNCGPGHGVSIGSLANSLNEAGVQNVTVKSVTFTGTQNGIRIKTWGRPSNGFVKGVVYQQIIMNNVQNPILIDQNYCPGIKGCPTQSSGIKISQVTYNNVQGTSATQVAVKFNCSPSNPCSQVSLQDIKLLYKNKPALSTCKYVGGTSSGILIPESCL